MKNNKKHARGDTIADDLKKKLEKMLDVEINAVEEEDDTIHIDLDTENIGKAIGHAGANIRAAEKVIGRKIEVIKEDEE